MITIIAIIFIVIVFYRIGEVVAQVLFEQRQVGVEFLQVVSHQEVLAIFAIFIFD